MSIQYCLQISMEAFGDLLTLSNSQSTLATIISLQSAVAEEMMANATISLCGCKNRELGL